MSLSNVNSPFKRSRTGLVLSLVLVLGCGAAIPLNNADFDPVPNTLQSVEYGTAVLPVRFSTPGCEAATGTWQMRVYFAGADSDDDPVINDAGSFEFAITDPYPTNFVAQTNANISGLSAGYYWLCAGKVDENDDVKYAKFEFIVEAAPPLD